MATDWLVVGPPVNCASRIAQTGMGNRCVLGPVAAGMADFASRRLRGPSRVEGKAEDVDYLSYDLCMKDLWIEGCPAKDQLSYLS